MRTIFKYALEKNGLIPAIFNKEDILHVGYDANNTPCFWALVNTDKDAMNRRCRIIKIGTGWDIEDTEYLLDTQITRENYIGTLKDGPYMWHYFIEFFEEEY